MDDCVCDLKTYPFVCPRYNKEMREELHGICQGTFLPDQRERYIASWERVRDAKANPKPPEPARLPMPCPHRLAELRTVECKPCQGGPQAVYGCELHKECVRWGNAETRRQKIKDCGNCKANPENLADELVPELSITMAVFDDYEGAWMTVMDLLMHHDIEDCEIVVGDNNPDSKHGQVLRDVCLGTDRVRYVTIRDVSGSSLPKDRTIQHARGKAVLHLDCHVILPPGVIARLKQFYRDNPETLDLFTGPILHRPGVIAHTHQDLKWRGGNLGTWALNKQVLDGEPEAFEIPQNGTGLFSFRREAWLGYHPSFRGYGGNETYLYEKFRRHGRKTINLPWLRWLHRFGRPGGTGYPNRWADKCRNYLITLDTLGWDRQPMLEHYVKAWGSPTKLAAAVASYEAEFPLATCVMEMAPQAEMQAGIKSFFAQEWPRKELQIISPETLPLDDPRIKVVKKPQGQWQIPWQPGPHPEHELLLKMKASGHAFLERSPLYQETLEEWKKAGGNASGAIPRKLWLLLASCLEPGLKTLEFGSGVSTWLFDRTGCEHLALESNAKWRDRVQRGLRRSARVDLCGLVARGDDPPFYDWQPTGGPYDVILVDGPFGEGNRAGALPLIDQVAGPHSVIFVDDCHRPGEASLAHWVALRTGKHLRMIEDGKRKVGVIL